MLARSTMRWFALLFVTSCLPIEYAAPSPPSRVLPDIPMPPDPPAKGAGRVVIDVAGEQAKVAKVVEVPSAQTLSKNGEPVPYGRMYLVRRDELLCVSPCVLDLPQGAYALSFTSMTDRTRTSTADVVASSQPSAVRHVIGRDKPVSWPYASGLLLTLMGGVIATGGGAVTGLGLAMNTTTRDDAAHPTAGKSGPSNTTVITVGLVALGIGLLTGAGGIALMNNNRPEHQDGATTYWTLPSNEPAAVK